MSAQTSSTPSTLVDGDRKPDAHQFVCSLPASPSEIRDDDSSISLNAWPNLLWIARADGSAEWFNSHWHEYTGTGVAESAGSGWLASIHPDDRGIVSTRWKVALDSGATLQVEHRLFCARDGEYRWHLTRAVPRRNRSGNIDRWYGTSTDIHALHQTSQNAVTFATTTEARLDLQVRQAERRFAQQLDFTRGITDSLAVGLYAVDLNGHATFVNPAAERMLGWRTADLVGKDMHQVIHYQHGDHSEFPKDQCPLLAVLKSGSVVGVDDDVFTARDGTLLPVSYQSAAVTDDGKIIGAVVSFQDITDRKQNEQFLLRYNEELEKRVLERTLELRDTNVLLQSSNRELQDFASVASHDLQEPLRKIQAFGDRLATRSGEALGHEGQDYLRRMKNAAGRMQSLISDLLSFSRITTKAQPFVRVNLNDIASDVMNDLESAVEANGGRVEIGNLPTIEADALQMRQLLQNLIANALKFRKPDVPSIIRVESRVVTEPRDGQPLELCEISVQDNGIGFDEKYLDRIFNVFPRLHGRSAYEGTGIGLAVCRKIAERHGGAITAQSAPDAGSTFIVTLPVDFHTPPASSAETQQEPHAR